MIHEQRITQHLSGYRERHGRCVCGRIWPCIKMFEPERIEEPMPKEQTRLERARAAVHSVLTMYGPTSLHASLNEQAHKALDSALNQLEGVVREEIVGSEGTATIEEPIPPTAVPPARPPPQGFTGVVPPPLPPGAEPPAKTDDGSIVIKDKSPPTPVELGAAPENADGTEVKVSNKPNTTGKAKK